MTTVDDPPGNAQHLVAERGAGTLLYESARTRVLRRPVIRPRPAPDAGDRVGSATIEVIWKEPQGPEATERMRHETGILTCLAGVPGVAHLVPTGEPGNSIGFALEDLGGRSLASTLADSGVGRGVRRPSEVVDLVEARPPRRMSLGQIDAVLRRIEDV
jgi:hypothetical protein